MIPIEICINSKSEQYVLEAVGNAWSGGAGRIELCASMEHDGLTPPVGHIEKAREAFRDRSGLMVMIRPKPGDFFYQSDDITLMETQIADAAKAGADGVVIGVLDPRTGDIHRTYCERLVDHARLYDLSVTFHRAFDATPDWRHSMDTVITMGISRVLSSGMKWGGAGTALDGINQLADMIEFAEGNIELVAGGGVNHTNASVIISELRGLGERFSLHAYSSVLEGDSVSSDKVALLKVLAES